MLLCLGLTGGVAQAEPIAGGETKVWFSPQLRSKIGKEGVRLSGVGPAVVKGPATLPVQGSEIDFTRGYGLVTHAGGIRFKAGRRSVVLREIALDTSTVNKALRGKFRKRSLRIAEVRGVSYTRDGFGGEIWARKLVLTQAAAALLNRRLQTPGLFKAGRSVGALNSSFQPTELEVVSGSLMLVLDPNTDFKLGKIGVEQEPFEASVFSAGPPPIYTSNLIGGRIYPGRSSGVALVESGLRLVRQSPWTQLTWTNLGVDLDSKRSGVLFPGGGPLAALNTSGTNVLLDPRARTLTAVNVGATLEADAARVINETFAPPGEPVVAAGDPLGSFAVTLQAR
ncbi:MAG TPA: hypothetical protein VF030_02885 [Solirubrobacterales bacterium]